MGGTVDPVAVRRRVTIVDVARHAGVSTAAASKVVRNAYGVSDAMRQRVEHAIGELGYRPDRRAQGMRGRTNTIGVMFTDLENPFFGVLVRGIRDRLLLDGFELFVTIAGTLPDAHDAVVHTLIDHRMDGLLLIAPRLPGARLEEIGREIPTVVIGRHGPSEWYDTVASDDLRGSALLVEHLIELGHQRVLYTGNEQATSDATLPERVRQVGFERAMTARGHASGIEIVETPWDFAGGQELGRRLAAGEFDVTAVHAGADVVAFGVLDALWNADAAVPDWYSVVGYDNSPVGGFRPVSLTSVDQEGTSMGGLAAERLLERIGGRRDPVAEVIEPRLVPRGTSGPAAAR